MFMLIRIGENIYKKCINPTIVRKKKRKTVKFHYITKSDEPKTYF